MRKALGVDRGEVAARVEIGDLVARYNALGDSGKWDDMLALFADDAVMVIDGERHHGRDAIRAIFTGAADGLARTKATHVRHFTATHQIDLTSDDAATGRCYFQVLTDIGLDHWGRYIDDYRRVDDRWRFASRRVSVDGSDRRSRFT